MKPKTHDERLRFADGFADYWAFDEVGQLFEVPDREQIFVWLNISGWDFALLEECCADLVNRASQTPAMNPADPWEHAVKHFSATLIRKTRAKHGKVRPTLERAA